MLPADLIARLDTAWALDAARQRQLVIDSLTGKSFYGVDVAGLLAVLEAQRPAGVTPDYDFLAGNIRRMSRWFRRKDVADMLQPENQSRLLAAALEPLKTHKDWPHITGDMMVLQMSVIRTTAKRKAACAWTA